MIPPAANPLYVLPVGAAGAYPVIYFCQLELPQLADAVSRQTLAVDPTVNRVARHTKMGHDLLDGVPAFRVPRTRLVVHSRISSHKVGNHSWPVCRSFSTRAHRPAASRTESSAQ